MNGRRKKIAAYRSEERTQKIEYVLSKRHRDFTIVAENIIDKHNLSALFRTCDAVGILKAYLIYDGTQPTPKLAESSSASARKWVESEVYKNVADCYAELRKQGKKIYTTHLAKDSVSLYDLDLTEPFAIVLGNEHSGVSERAVELADANVIIPQAGMIQSLNISVACAVSIYEAFRQRIKSGKFDSLGLQENEYNEKLIEWLEK
jgi:tRNA (guanosine-2'-O-)-methyltransferase